MHKFFDKSPEAVAKDLVGMGLEINGKRGIILAAKPQSRRDNAFWVDKRPLFGPKAVDMYVAPYRGNHMLFLRTGPRDTCVRIDSMEINGQKLRNPGQVCKALGLKGERAGKLSLRGNVVSLS